MTWSGLAGETSCDTLLTIPLPVSHFYIRARITDVDGHNLDYGSHFHMIL